MFEMLFASKQKLNILFEAAWEKGEFYKAVRIGRKLINKDNNDYKNLNNVAMLHFKLGFYEHALNYLLKANIIKETAFHWENIARVQQALKNFERAINSYSKALEIEPRRMSAWYHLSKCYKEQQDLKLACDVLTKLILVYPENSEARIDLGIYMLLQGKVEKAKVHFDNVLTSSNSEKIKASLLNRLYKYRTKPYTEELLSYYKALKIG